MAAKNEYGETLTREDKIPSGWKIGVGGYEHTDGDGYDWYWAVIDGDNVAAINAGVTVAATKKSDQPAAPKNLWPWLAGGGALLLIIILSLFFFRKKK